MSASNSELDELIQKFEKQTALLETLENQLNSLNSNNNEAELIKTLTTENDKLRYRIKILKKSIEDANSNIDQSLTTTTSKF